MRAGKDWKNGRFEQVAARYSTSRCSWLYIEELIDLCNDLRVKLCMHNSE